jgi:hypothetical protein
VLLDRRPRSSRRIRLIGLGAGGSALLAILATAGATRTESPQPDRIQTAIDSEVTDPRTQLSEHILGEMHNPRPVLGYRRGQRERIRVVALGSARVEVGTARAFLSMRQAAAQDGIELRIESGFRNRRQQAALYRAWRKGKGNPAARPGRSNHQSGRALDISVSAPGTLEWLQANASAFGFKRTVSREPWHWEYVNTPRARAAKRPARSKRAARADRANRRAARANKRAARANKRAARADQRAARADQRTARSDQRAR